jgi:hypothetical protein
MVRPETGWVSRWVVSLFDPLVDTDSRIEIEAGLKDIIAQHPHWFAAWFSGHLSDIVRSLDPVDPWRNLQVVDGRALHEDGSPFGTWVDSTDLAQPAVPDMRSDLALAALRTPLSEDSAVLIAVASGGWHATLSWCEQHLVTESSLDPAQAEKFFRTASASLRWALHRRRLYLGPEDSFIPVNGIAWIGRAHNMIAGTEWDEARAERVLAESSVAPGTYTQLT